MTLKSSKSHKVSILVAFYVLDQRPIAHNGGVKYADCRNDGRDEVHVEASD
jgi:hypothetical protein